MRILIVEDEVRLADALAAGLRAEGFSVDVARDGSDGLERAREGTFAAIVLDLLLPGMNGYEICETLRAEQIWTPILMLTAKDGEYDEAEALDTGADDFLSKPFSYVVLVARLRALIRRGSVARPAKLSVGDLTLDPATREVCRGEQPIALTPREFALVESLMRRSGEVITKQQLLADVWGEEFGGDPNLVEVYVRYVRRKVDEPFGRQTLRTVRGVGYRLVADGAGGRAGDGS
ncbi:response regulator transcription factor [Pendulispora albinea]|uniref:Response regulator transcription factor n=1 Tax=Pendulispora albinea TaxID=2741071 RepID=A0ABZ2M0H9_9BACT